MWTAKSLNTLDLMVMTWRRMKVNKPIRGTSFNEGQTGKFVQEKTRISYRDFANKVIVMGGKIRFGKKAYINQRV